MRKRDTQCVGESNTEIVRRAFEAEDLGDFLGALAPDVIWDLTNAPGPEADVLRGTDQVVGFLRRWLGAWSDYRVEVEDAIETADCVLLVYRQSGRARTSGIALNQRDYAVATVHDGVIVKVEVHGDSDRARAAAGLD